MGRENHKEREEHKIEERERERMERMCLNK